MDALKRLQLRETRMSFPVETTASYGPRGVKGKRIHEADAEHGVGSAASTRLSEEDSEQEEQNVSHVSVQAGSGL